MAEARTENRADNARLAEDRRKSAQEREARAKAQQERYEKRGTPTPTQEEADLLVQGHHIELANDGSGPDPNMPQPQGQQHEKHERHQEASQSGGGYSTRQTAAQHKP